MINKAITTHQWAELWPRLIEKYGEPDYEQYEDGAWYDVKGTGKAISISQDPCMAFAGEEPSSRLHVWDLEDGEEFFLNTKGFCCQATYTKD